MNFAALSRFCFLRRTYATVVPSLGKKKKLGKAGGAAQKIVLPVETDAKKLTKFVCGSNLLKEGGQDVELKPDSEYPDWLWSLNIGKPKKLEEMDPDSKEYWLRVKKLNIIRNSQLKKIKKF